MKPAIVSRVRFIESLHNTFNNSIKLPDNDNKTSEINLNNNPLSLLNKSTISFSGMKKSQFSGIDLIMINSLTKTQGFNIQSKDINSNDDFQQYCQNILDNKYLGSDNIKKLSASFDNDTQKLKEAMLTQWIDCLSNDKEKYTPSIQLLILSSITKDLDINTTNIPPVLNSKVLNLTIDEIIENSKTNKNYSPNFNKTYRSNLQKNILQSQLDENLTGWIIIPSKEHDEEHFEDNVKRLQTLSHNNWCTVTYKAEPYLAKGDFHIYFELCKPKIGIRFENGEISEIEGERNNSKIPTRYYNVVSKYVKNSYIFPDSIQNKFEQAQKAIETIQQMKSELGEDVFENKEYDKILPYFGIEVTKDENGLLTLDHYCQPSVNLDFYDIGIDENDLFKHIKEIKGDANFKNSQLFSLGNLESIGGDANFYKSRLVSLGNLESIDGNASFYKTQLVSLDDLKIIKGNVSFYKSQLTSLGSLEAIGGNANFYESKLTSLDNLKTIGGNADFQDSQLKNLGNLKTIGGNADFQDSQLVSLGNLELIYGNANFEDSKIVSLGNLRYIGEDANFENSEVVSLENLEYIGGNANFENSKVISLGNLGTIKGDASFYKGRLTSLGKLKEIRGNASFVHSKVISLDDLEYIGGYADFRNSKVVCLENLKAVGGIIYFAKNQLASLDELKRLI